MSSVNTPTFLQDFIGFFSFVCSKLNLLSIQKNLQESQNFQIFSQKAKYDWFDRLLKSSFLKKSPFLPFQHSKTDPNLLLVLSRKFGSIF